MAILVGTILAWVTGLVTWNPEQLQTAIAPLGIYVPTIDLVSLWQAKGVLVSYFSVILPMGLFNLVGSLQNLESAAAAGDDYPTGPCLAVNGLGYHCGSPIWFLFSHHHLHRPSRLQRYGARIGYSWLNGLVMALLCLTGSLGLLVYLIPIDSGMAIVLWIGIIIVTQSFSATPTAHYPAVVIGLTAGHCRLGCLGGQKFFAGSRPGNAGKSHYSSFSPYL